MKTLRRTINPEVRILDSTRGLVEYVASDESLDSYREVIRADGWRFDRFQRNAPFVDSHDYSTIGKLLGSVTDFKVDGRQLVETVRWAIDVAENTLAKIGWRMLEAGHLKAVSVGFFPEKLVTKWDQDPTAYNAELLKLSDNHRDAKSTERPNVIYLQQQQIELSACIIGANPNALAKCYKAGLIDDAELDLISMERCKLDSRTREIEEKANRDERVQPRSPTLDPELVEWALAQEAQARRRFIGEIEQITKAL